MNRFVRIALLGLVPLALTGSGCPFKTGQVVVNLDLGTLHVSSADPVDRHAVNLNDNSDYVDHKADLHAISDFAVLGVVNNGPSELNFEVWMTPGTTAYTTAEDVKAHATKLWGPLVVAGPAPGKLPKGLRSGACFPLAATWRGGLKRKVWPWFRPRRPAA